MLAPEALDFGQRGELWMEGQVEEESLLRGFFLRLRDEALFFIRAGQVGARVVDPLLEEGKDLACVVTSCKQAAVEHHKLLVDVRAQRAQLVDPEDLAVDESC